MRAQSTRSVNRISRTHDDGVTMTPREEIPGRQAGSVPCCAHTLWRLEWGLIGESKGTPVHPAKGACSSQVDVRLYGFLGVHVRGAHEPARLVGADRQCQDRKSTRLNSSHSQISYAVFCL